MQYDLASWLKICDFEYCNFYGRNLYAKDLMYSYHQSVLPKGRSFTANAGTKVAVLPKAGIPLQIQEPRL